MFTVKGSVCVDGRGAFPPSYAKTSHQAGTDGYCATLLAAKGRCREDELQRRPEATRTNPTSMMKDALEPSSCTSPVVYAD